MKIYPVLIIVLLLRLITDVIISLPLELDSGHYNQVAIAFISEKGFGNLSTRPLYEKAN